MLQSLLSFECCWAVDAFGILHMEISGDAIVPYKKRVHAIGICSHERISLRCSKGDQGREACAVVIAFVPRKSEIIGNGHGRLVGNAGVVLHDHDAGDKMCDRFPDPIVVAVDVDTEEIEFLRHIVLCKERLDILCRDEFLMEIERRIVMVSIHEEAFPSLVFEEIARIALDAVLHAEFYIVPVCRTDHRKNRGNDAIFAVLGVLATLNEGNSTRKEMEMHQWNPETSMEQENDIGKEEATEPEEGLEESAADAVDHLHGYTIHVGNVEDARNKIQTNDNAKAKIMPLYNCYFGF